LLFPLLQQQQSVQGGSNYGGGGGGGGGGGVSGDAVGSRSAAQATVGPSEGTIKVSIQGVASASSSSSSSSSF